MLIILIFSPLIYLLNCHVKYLLSALLFFYDRLNFLCLVDPVKSIQHRRYLCLDELFVKDIIWVDENKGLLDATSHIEGCKVIGVDCEWKPNHVKGSKPNKVIYYNPPDRLMFMLEFFLVDFTYIKLNMWRLWYDFSNEKPVS